MQIQIGVSLDDDLAAAFLQEVSKRVAAGQTASKADMARTLIAEALQARGHDIEVPDTQWGVRRQTDENEGQELAVPA